MTDTTPHTAMENALLSAMDWWDVSGADVPEIAPQSTKRRVRSAPPPSAKTAPPNTATQSPATLPPPTSDDERPALAAELAARAKTLTELRAAIESFDAGALSDNARSAVFSRGNADAEIMIIGEAPGAEEDQHGKPFIGAAGQLLDRIIGSIGLTDAHVYITNVVNWRPPNNRKPNAEEIAMCLPFIQRHIALKNPKLIILLGGTAMTALTDLKGITKTRGSWVEVKTEDYSANALITYHPAYLLRRPDLKRDVWRDMLAFRAKLIETDISL